MEKDSAALAIHAGEVVAQAWGRCLWLPASRRAWEPLPPTVHSVVTLEEIDANPAPVDTVVSVGQLSSCPDPAALLDRLTRIASPSTELLFCEPTVTGGAAHGASGPDVTATLWAGGWSVLDCHRFRSRRGPRRDYVWGRARPTPARQPGARAG